MITVSNGQLKQWPSQVRMKEGAVEHQALKKPLELGQDLRLIMGQEELNGVTLWMFHKTFKPFDV